MIDDDAEISLGSVYREQWGAIGVPFKTTGILLNARVYRPFENLNIHLGMLYLNDQSGDAKMLVNRLHLSLGASYELGQNTFYFSVDNALVSREFNATKLTFPAQYDRSIGDFNESLSSNENFNNQKGNAYRLSLGLAYQRIVNELWTIKAGFSLANLNQAGIGFYTEEIEGNQRLNSQLTAIYAFRPHLDLTPYLAYSRLKRASETVLGSGLRFKTQDLGNVKSIEPFLYSRLGVQRNIDALILGSYLELGNFLIGASYDFNISNLELASNYQGAFELSLSYKIYGKSIQTKPIPCERL